ncbi:hypothetical protein RM533_12995 [Croceicoccus sp. F390]|uniref:Uncharacterized protein n=1 Tax=Croceicoccus esteveae TaxID=3075597 RepID=A0ABU2ZM28_9SPHN|nr:hypothetical protein [Croceicoccus sp. F390]MDT0577083.1 hypothetical protein [Croceicoccus sp. F390]
MLCLASEDDRATLVPASFDRGACRLDDARDLHHSAEAPASSFDRADGDMVRAYKRLIAIQPEQWERGDTFDLPYLTNAACLTSQCPSHTGTEQLLRL